MKDKVPAVTLSRLGWIYDTHPKFDHLMAHWVLSDHRQSELMPTGVHNLHWLIYENLQDMLGTSTSIQNSLTAYLGKYFDDVNVTCRVTLTNPDKSATMYTISLSITFTSNGRHVDGSRALVVENGKFIQYANYNNTGDVMLSA